MMRSKTTFMLLPPLLIIALVACAGEAEPTTVIVSPSDGLAAGSTAPLVVDLQTDDAVTLRESTVTWQTYQYELTEDYGIVAGSYDGQTKVERTYKSWILENKFLKVTLVPEMGGRILSIVYKPSGHEELYQNPVGVPYQIGTGVFYYDWLMVYGGIFPTLPEPEHGKTWLLPWQFEVLKDSDQEVVVAMSIVDDIDNRGAPAQYDLGPTGLELIYTVSLKAGRAAVDTTVTVTNPGDDEVAFEYWTNTTLAPGSDPLDPKTTAGAEIIAPVDMIKIPNYWRAVAAQEEQAGFTHVYEFANLRRFANWPDMGIAYAFPDMAGHNFWGVINHDNDEGIFRIADNTVTPGMKIWTWGYPLSTSVDPQAAADEARPYVELWAGVTREFWQRAALPAQGQLVIEATYSPSIGLADVTHASGAFLVDLAPVDRQTIACRLFGLYPDQTVRLTMDVDGVEFYETEISVDPDNGNSCAAEIPDTISGDTLNLAITSESDVLLFKGAVALSLDQ